MPKVTNTRSDKATELMRLITEGPTFSGIAVDFTPIEAKQQTRRWLESWVEPLVRELVRELRDGVQFEVRIMGERNGQRVSLQVLMDDNREDKELRAWLPRARIKQSKTFGGGAAPLIEIKRVA